MIQESLGQLVCGGFQGTTVTPQAYELIVKYKVLTMILSRRNAQSVDQMVRLIHDLQRIALEQAHYKYPLLLAIDEEGGMLNLLFDPQDLTQFPGAMALAASGDVELVYAASRAMARELRHIGFSMVLGPVLDVITKMLAQLVSVRAFGTTVEDVARYGMACARGLRDGGLITVGKHFPGIGAASVDLLLELPMMTESLDQLRRVNVVPFHELIRAGVLDGISAAGCGVPMVSPDETHACLLPVLLTQLLRHELGFDGFVISECLEMDALYHLIGLGQGAVLAVCAGCDLVMCCHDFKRQVEAIELLAKALANGMLDEAIILASLRRIEAVQRRVAQWADIFPEGPTAPLPRSFRVTHPEWWRDHQQLARRAYRLSITLVRDFEDSLPLTKWGPQPAKDVLALPTVALATLNPLNPLTVVLTALNPDLTADLTLLHPGSDRLKQVPVGPQETEPLSAGSTDPDPDPDPADSILVLTPLLNPVYPIARAAGLHTGEEVFQRFGEQLARHPNNRFNVLHTTYTANGLTAFHEQLIANAKAVVVVTSEALRNMYQMGIVKYVSVLCGAAPLGLLRSRTPPLLAKPLVLVATLSPYDFFYNRTIGSAYLCCYDYTENALDEVAAALMGDFVPQGCVPGEEKYNHAKRRRLLEGVLGSAGAPKIRRAVPPTRRWLVDEFDAARDWRGLLALVKANKSADYSDEYVRRLLMLLHSHVGTQKHFVVRNSSLNIVYGVVLTWVEDTGSADAPDTHKVGKILYLLVDRTKRLQLVGRNLHARAVRYLYKEQGCADIQLGCSFPLIGFQDPGFMATDPTTMSFLNVTGWSVGDLCLLPKLHAMMLTGLAEWAVPHKIFRELTIVGVRFDICQELAKLDGLIARATDGGGTGAESPAHRHVRHLYKQASTRMASTFPHEAKVIIALEPANQSVIGSIVLFTNKSLLARFYPFIENSSATKVLVGGIVCPVIDPSYSNLTEILKFGLICSAITYLRTNFCENPNAAMDQCIMMDVPDDKSFEGVKDIGFDPWHEYRECYDRLSGATLIFEEAL